PDDDALPGIDVAVNTPAVASNYLNHAEKTWELVQSLPRGGNAVFTVPRPPVSCTGTTLKPLFLAAAHWKRSGRLPHANITLVVDRPHLLGVPELDARLHRHLADLDVNVQLGAAVTAVHPDERECTVTSSDGVTQRLPYDMLHLVPPFRGPEWITASGLFREGSHGLADVDPHTFRHRLHPQVWAVGDCASVDTDPSGGALRRQVSILVDNILAVRNGHA
ncbi:pyridine nucleotide-disulfide oxidoreductase, partial [Mycobacterium sp. ITM-2017-0098]